MSLSALKVSGSQVRFFWGLLASTVLLAGCGGGGGTVPPLVNVCEEAFSPEFFASIGLRRQGDSRSGTLGPNSLLEFYFDSAGEVQNAREVPPPPGTFTFYSDGFLYFPSAANVTGVTIRLTSPVFDPLLVIGAFDTGRNLDRNVLFVNDDAAPGNFTTSQLTIPVRQDRCYLIQVQSYWAQNASPTAGPGSPGRGPYTLQVVSETFATPPPLPPLQQKPEDPENGGGGDRGGGVGI
ncbi:hypothetical protein NW851_12415 [Synechococcus sp. H55.7]|uniref:hypothetical protein n=1 Tax=unclassified Synechococcus TaxID=2626047 RepID=UPI0039C4D804